MIHFVNDMNFGVFGSLLTFDLYSQIIIEVIHSLYIPFHPFDPTRYFHLGMHVAKPEFKHV
jgi:hypothetical protein